MTTLTLSGQTCGLRWSDELDPCGQPAVALVIGGCVHEHITRDHLCVDHLGPALARKFHCHPCWDGPDSHGCPVLAREVTS
ncbi:hypothetical protein [Actinomadura sp. 9N215]|uniref:hypothetical protein n=1 Tax=Actinomadura sp. 9N215 TaxID=3375150 RepID=UPI0037A568FD